MRELPFSRIYCPPGPLPGAVTRESYQDAFRIAYSNPSWPAGANTNSIDGKVVLDAVVGKDGIIQSLSFRSGNPMLREPALETVRHWTYRPLKVNGVPVEVATQIEVGFV